MQDSNRRLLGIGIRDGSAARRRRAKCVERPCECGNEGAPECAEGIRVPPKIRRFASIAKGVHLTPRNLKAEYAAVYELSLGPARRRGGGARASSMRHYRLFSVGRTNIALDALALVRPEQS